MSVAIRCLSSSPKFFSRQLRFSSTQTIELKNVNLKDVNHHSEYSRDWWDPNGPMKALHALNQLRVPFIRDGLLSTAAIDGAKINRTNILDNIKILEVGCGAGILSEALGRLKAEVVALDPSEELLSTARQRLVNREKLNIKYCCEIVEDHAKENIGMYDAVVASEVLEHVSDQKSFINACVSALKPGGSIFITTFNKTQASWLGGIVVAEHVLKLIPPNTHDWNLFISPGDVEKILKELNCQTILTHGIHYEFWNNTCKWSRCTDINYALHAVKQENYL